MICPGSPGGSGGPGTQVHGFKRSLLLAGTPAWCLGAMEPWAWGAVEVGSGETGWQRMRQAISLNPSVSPTDFWFFCGTVPEVKEANPSQALRITAWDLGA